MKDIRKEKGIKSHWKNVSQARRTRDTTEEKEGGDTKREGRRRKRGRKEKKR